MQTSLKYRNDFSDANYPLVQSPGTTHERFLTGGPNNGPFARFMCSTTDEGYFGTRTRIGGQAGELGRTDARYMVVGWWMRVRPRYFEEPVSGWQKVIYINRSTNRTMDRPMVSFGYGGANPRGYYAITNNTDNPRMASVVDFNPQNYAGQWFHTILILNLDDTTLVDSSSRMIDGTLVTTPGTYSMCISTPDRVFRNTLVQREVVDSNLGTWSYFDFIGGYARPDPNGRKGFDLGPWALLN